MKRMEQLPLLDSIESDLEEIKVKVKWFVFSITVIQIIMIIIFFSVLGEKL